MAARRPIVSSGGRRQQLPAGDTLLGVPAYMPAYQANGALLRLALNLNYSLPAQLAGGGALSIQVVING
jgi:hypothetical protein